MQDKYLYEYAVIRVVPRVEREEFLNVGIILYCSKQGFLEAKIQVNEERFKAFPCTIEISELQEYLSTWERICKGGKEGGTIGIIRLLLVFVGSPPLEAPSFRLQKLIQDFVIMPPRRWNACFRSWLFK